MYAYIDGVYVYDVYDDISQYSEDFKRHCVEIPEGIDVRSGYLYTANTFVAPPPFIGVPPPENDIKAAKTVKIAKSKDKLADWLTNNPMTYTDGKQYSVTAEKQSLLNGNLASYERARSAGLDYPLRWNATGEECTAYTYEALVGLSLAIAAYVAPKVSQQQEIEITINACETLEQLNEVVISYE